jgi:Rrf2 family transcriptional regulator, iron-sulfur cluster assembly transcription factor
MDLQLTRRADYAVRAALFLAAAWGDGSYRKIREVSAAMAIPRSFTPQVLGDLVGAGLAEARAGRGGGYRLTRPPSEISLLEVVEGSEGTLLPQRCTLRGTACDPTNPCPVHPAWFEAAQRLRGSLAEASLHAAVASDTEFGRRLATSARAGVTRQERTRRT